MADRSEEWSFQAEYRMGAPMPPEAIAQGDQALASALDIVRNARQFIILAQEKIEDDAEGISCQMLSSTHGNMIEVVNFLYIAHREFHDRLDQVVRELPIQMVAYLRYLENGGQMTSPYSFDDDGE